MSLLDLPKTVFWCILDFLPPQDATLLSLCTKALYDSELLLCSRQNSIPLRKPNISSFATSISTPHATTSSTYYLTTSPHTSTAQPATSYTHPSLLAILNAIADATSLVSQTSNSHVSASRLPSTWQ